MLKWRRGQRVVRHGDRVLKISTSVEDMENQYTWFRHFHGMPGVPAALGLRRWSRGAVLVLEYVDARPLHHVVLSSDSDPLRLLTNAVAAVQGIHGTAPTAHATITRADFASHYIGKVLARFETARALIPSLNRTAFRVNGTEVMNPYRVVRRRRKRILQLLMADAVTAPVHGDPNLSNLLCGGPDEPVVFVDPRGTFGTKRILDGDTMYDAARLTYSLHGFCDVIDRRGFLRASTPAGFDVIVTGHELFRDLAPRFDQIVMDRFGLSPQGLAIREALLFLSAVPLHAHSPFEMHALLGLGIERLDASGMV
jgi:hypothetical protein